MDRVFEFEIPLLHPIAVHFPIVLLLITALVVVIWAFKDQQVWLRASAMLGSVGALAAFIATRTGEDLEGEMQGDPMVELFVDLHEASADWTVLLAVTLAVCLTALLFGGRIWPRNTGTPTPLRILVVLLALSVAGVVAWTGHLGGLMVWGVPV
ncbi:MAG: putative membrane protein [Rhodothermales bacterium]|jgi:uncharacterized membrane protein